METHSESLTANCNVNTDEESSMKLQSENADKLYSESAVCKDRMQANCETATRKHEL